MKKLLTILFAVALGLNLSAQVPDYVPTEGLVAWYPFNGNANDESGNGNDGIVNGATPSSDRHAIENLAYSFNGESSYILIESDFDSNERSVCLWVKASNIEASLIYDTDHTNLDYGLTQFGCGTWSPSSFGIGVGHPGGMNTFQANGEVDIWYMLSVTRDSDSTRYFFNGSIGHTVANGNVSSNGGPSHTWIGTRRGAVNRFFHGSIDDIGIWNRALSEAEILALYNADPPVAGCTDLTACNYNEEATSDDGSCIPSGCMETEACNYNALAECEGEACDYTCCPGPGCCSAGMYWDYDLEQCLNYETCQEDLDGDGVIGINDLMELLSSFGTMCEEPETGEFTCGDPMNYHGYDYATVQIGDQCWFAENLQSEYYQNGDGLQADLSNLEWTNANFGTQCIYENIDENLGLYGRLYNWHAVNDERGVCPANWHVPSQTEWFALVDYAAPESGLKLKADSLSTPAWNGTDYLGFSATPAGRRDYASGQFLVLNEHAYWWTGTQTSDDRARLMHISSELTVVESLNYFFEHGFSVRCLKDTEE